MTLIEVILTYQECLQKSGRAQANQFLIDAVDECLHWHIHHTFDDAGNFISFNGSAIKI